MLRWRHISLKTRLRLETRFAEDKPEKHASVLAFFDF
jgi:hypothetical protein